MQQQRAFLAFVALVGLEVALVLGAPTKTDDESSKNATCRFSQHGAVYIISGGESRPWTQAITYNHEEYARKNGHSYRFVPGNSAAPRKPYWSKIRQLIDELANPTLPKVNWILWCDDDIVITALDSDMLGRWQHDMVAKGKDVSVSEDPAKFTVVNTGMILVRRSERALRLLQDLWRFGSGFLSNCPQDRCLHEQQALRNLYNFGVAGDPDRYKNILLVVPQRRKADDFNINTFHRESHYDPCREAYRDYDSDASHSRWAPGDFTCHVSGMNMHLRAKLLAECLEAAHGPNQFPSVTLMNSRDACGVVT
jgi:hypothetical protein